MCQDEPELLSQCREEEESEREGEDEDEVSDPNEYPPRGSSVEAMMLDIRAHCRYPVDLESNAPAEVSSLLPENKTCRMCQGCLSEPIYVTDKGRIFDIHYVQEGTETSHTFLFHF
jgi:hypothetical protein